MAEMISTRELSERTGYSVNYICGLVRSGELTPVGEINGGHAFNPNALAPKPDSGRRKADDPLSAAIASPYHICGFCTSYGNLCSQTGKRVAYHRVACEVYNQDPDAIERAIRPPTPPPAEIKTYFIEVNEMDKKSITPAVKQAVLDEQKTMKRKVSTREEIVAVTKSVKPDMSTLHHDLELAQQAMVLVDTVRQVWGEVEPIQDAVLQEYARRRAQ